MNIREANPADIPEIVEVLKASLGETDLPLSKEIWNFKHVNNPFGPSIVLVATEENKIVGVRAFMRWQWQLGQKTYKALRAVDTATHPKHQGKGIFKKLTLKAVEISKKSGENFIFNTPNDQSRPGYLKMGWEISGKIRVALQPAYFSFWKHAGALAKYRLQKNISSQELDALCEQWNKKLSKKEKLFTPKSSAYLKWRFEENVLQNYEIIAEKDFYLACYVKKRSNLKELRISECIYTLEDKTIQKKIRKELKEIGKKFCVQIISYAPNLTNFGLPAIKGNYGPILTVKALNLEALEKEKFLVIDTWSNSIGDLELF